MADVLGKITLKNVRAAFANVHEPKAFEEGGPASYSLQCLLDPSTDEGEDNITLIEDTIEAVKQDKWADKQPKLPDSKICMRDGNEKEYDGFEDMVYLATSNKNKPLILNRMNQKVDDPGLIYSGCYCDVIVRIWAQDNKYGKRINASLEAVRFRSDGEAFAGSRVTAADFGDALDDPDEDMERQSRRHRDNDNEDEEGEERPRRGRRGRR